MSTITAYETTPHVPAGWTRAELRAMIGRYFGYRRGTAAGGSDSTLVDGELSRFADDYWNGACLYIAGAGGAAPQYEEATVTDFVSATGTLAFAPALSAPLAAGDVYELFQRVTASEIHDALNRVCAGGEAVHVLAPSTSRLDYSLDGVDGLYRPQQVVGVYVREHNDLAVAPFRLTRWSVEDDAGRLTLRLPATLWPDDALWIVYQLGPDGMQRDDSKTNLPPALVRAKAIVYLLENLLTRQDAGGLERYGTLLRDMREQAARAAAALQPSSRRALFHDWGARRRLVERLPRAYRIFGDLP